MKRNFLLVILIVMIMCISISDINAQDNDLTLNQSGDFDLNLDSKEIVNNIQCLNSITDDSSKNTQNISKQKTSINSSSVELFYKNGTRFSITLIDENNNTISNQTINFIINNVTYNRTTNFYGQTSLPINLSPGEYTVITIFNATGVYDGCTKTDFVKVLPTIKASDITKYYRNDTQFLAAFLDNNGNPLINTVVQFNINGVFYNRTTNESGVAKFSINLAPGEYILTSIQQNNGLQISNLIKVLPTIKASDITKYYRNDTQFLAAFLDNNGNPLINSIVQFNINGVFYNRTTNESGVAKLNINLAPGDYILTVIQLSNDLQSSYFIKVLSTIKADNIIKYYKNSTQYFACFVDGAGKPLNNINVSFNINGVFYNRTTNESGVAKLNINLAPGDYILTAHNKEILYSTNIKVLPTIEGMDLVKAFRDNNQYIVKFLKNDGTPASGISVTFNINGIFYNRITNNSGFTKLNINLAPGYYILTAYNLNDGCLISNNITVLINVATAINVENVSFMENESKIIEISLTDELGYNLENKQVELIAGNKLYNSTTDNNGKAHFIIDLAAGLYEGVYNFKGNDVYQPSTNSKLIRIFNGQDVIIDVLDSIIYNNDLFHIKVKDLNNTPLKNITIDFNINNKIIKSKTDENGIASVKTILNDGLNTIFYNVNQTSFDTLKRSYEVTVIPSNESILTGNITEVYEGAGSKFITSLKAGNIKLPNQLITFTINGVDYNRTTDSEGNAGITINLVAGEYIIKCFYGGNLKLKNTTIIVHLTVIKRLNTNINVISKNVYTVGQIDKFEVRLTDSENNDLKNQKIIFTLNDKEYTSITDNNGTASIDISNLNMGFYELNYRFDEFEKYLSSSGSSYIRIVPSELKGNGYWLFGRDMLSTDLPNLARQGTGVIFLNFAAFSTHGEAKVVNWIKKANNYGIKVHIWMQAFYDGNFISPVLADETPDYNLFNKKINDAKYYASIPGVTGIHLDYLRFPGTAYKHSGALNAINEFVKLCGEAIRSINPNIIYSAAVMPETTANAYYYGQDTSTLGKYLDVIVPMVYKGNYDSGSGWIGKTTKWFVDHSSGAQVWTGLQAYQSDDKVIPLSIDELTNDAKVAMNNGASGVIMFRWGLTNFINFNLI